MLSKPCQTRMPLRNVSVGRLQGGRDGEKMGKKYVSSYWISVHLATYLKGILDIKLFAAT